MDTNLTNRAQALYPNNTNYQAQWIKMVQMLGDKWLLAKKVARNG